MVKIKKGKPYFFSILILVVIILALAKLVVSNRLATFGQRLTQIEKERINLRKEKYVLEEKIYQLSSLESVRQRARIIGFDRQREIISFSREVPVALR